MSATLQRWSQFTRQKRLEFTNHDVKKHMNIEKKQKATATAWEILIQPRVVNTPWPYCALRHQSHSQDTEVSSCMANFHLFIV